MATKPLPQHVMNCLWELKFAQQETLREYIRTLQDDLEEKEAERTRLQKKSNNKRESSSSTTDNSDCSESKKQKKSECQKGCCGGGGEKIPKEKSKDDTAKFRQAF